MARKRNVINTVDSDWLTFISRMKSPEEEAAWRAATALKVAGREDGHP